MPELWFAASADRLLYESEADETCRRLFDRLNEVLFDLERDSNQRHLRRHRFQIGMWGVIAAAGADEWIVLWEPHPDIDDAIIIQYVGPSTF